MTKYKSIVDKTLPEYEKICKVFGIDVFEDAIYSPAVIHYADKIKPWSDKHCIFANYWWKYAKRSVFYNKIITNNIKKKIIDQYNFVKPFIYKVEQEKTHKVIKICGIKIKYKSPQIEQPKPIDYLNNTIEEPITIDKCPLCGSERYISAKDYEINKLIERWIKQYSFVPFPDCYKDKILERKICTNCGINYYNYTIPDTAEFYEKLGTLHNLYAKNKWDYDEAIKIIQKYKPNSVMDIGCGYGYFIEKIKNAVDYVVGSEFNPTAINTCNSKGIKLYTTNLKDIQEKFDMITAFQVFEHVKDNKSFIEDCINLINPNGYLLLVVPNPEGELIKYNPGILELPPHHCCDISKDAFEFISQKYGLEIVEYKQQEIEPWIYKIYLKEKYNINYNHSNMYMNYLHEKSTLVGKGHLVLYKKNK